MLDLEAIRPRASAHGKYSPLLFKWLRRHSESMRSVFLLKQDRIDGSPTTPVVLRPMNVWLGRCDAEGWVHGNSLAEIITERARHTWAAPFGGGFYDITDEFWATYAQIGRCAWDRNHRMSMINNDDRWHYHSGGRLRTCQWCGAEQEVRHERRIKVVERDVWVPYRASVPAEITWPRGSMGEEVVA